MNSSQLKQKSETIKLANTVILTSLSTIISVCLFIETLKTHELKKILLWQSCRLCLSGKQRFMEEHTPFVISHGVECSLPPRTLAFFFFFLEGVVESMKEKERENRKGGGKGSLKSFYPFV